ncbi:MAG: phosphoadenosine phosphosulfate reductase family protein [Cyclobacteriaceae bacterium]
MNHSVPISNQFDLFGAHPVKKSNYDLEDIQSADKFIVFFSGGKDSISLVLFLLDSGVPSNKIELWHHDIDGDGEVFMDWEITRDYCRAFAEAFNMPIYFSWKEGGFKGELLRENSLTKPIVFEDQNKNLVRRGGERGKIATRRRFPQVSPDLRVRFCSVYTKIDVATSAIIGQDRFKNSTTVVLSGERGEESTNRAKYNIIEPDRADGAGTRHRRRVIRWRPIRDWSEQEVWDIMAKYRVRPHPAYYLGWSRVSCKWCIFGNAAQFASAYAISPKQGDEIIQLESEFGVSIKRKEFLPELIAKGTPYPATQNKELVDLATSKIYTSSIILPEGEQWELPAGAFKKGCGPS